jgi:hypothetical protein
MMDFGDAVDWIAGVLRGHPLQFAIAVLVCALAARVIGRLALYAFVIALLVLGGTMLLGDVSGWIN